MMKGARGGFTLVEVMLAGAIAVLMTLSLMEGLVVSAKISHENSELLAADAFAWDTAWKWLNNHLDEFLRRRHDDDPVHGQRLENGERNIPSPRRHVDNHEIEFTPVDVGPELLDRTGDDRSAPYDR